MPRRYSTAEVSAALDRIGIRFVRQNGSHMRYSGRWRGLIRHVTLVAGVREITPGTLTGVLQQTGISLKELQTIIEKGTIAE
jgi:predicted RNA binding protein YcfA (HicA-like mRNA interferase family)